MTSWWRTLPRNLERGAARLSCAVLPDSLLSRRACLWSPALRGLAGEQLAAAALTKKKMRVLCRNWRNGHHEIDLVACTARVLVFVEVKTRGASSAGSFAAADAVNEKKKQHLAACAEAYLHLHEVALRRRGLRDVRFDLVTVQFAYSPPRIRIEHWPGERYWDLERRGQ